ncbi:4-alpha-glucanotransferase [Arsukibacterium tuosuense]|uniref:4-alpha-glucanotransferase n=1 Tax=Arsukibacterium tuosuense TaxID=1323745 RepID=A0A285I419_9GAMM|nr:4-alpha-glucanotransferase [Arsukibacterium tuosuense]SNY42710.1 4-alpha-glucanotransferase [Arsukibacterium tuosuense]
MDAALQAELVAFSGIETEFNDAWGNRTKVASADQLALLAAQGFNIADDAAARAELTERQLDFWQQILAPVSVQLLGEPLHFELQVPLALANSRFDFTLQTEQGASYQFSTEPVAGELVQVAVIEDEEYQQYQHSLTYPLETGYHCLTLTCSDTGFSFEQRLIISPGKCYQPAEFEQKKQWGVSVQLYGLRSARNWGIGDFSDLSTLVGYLSAHGADFVGLNPIHALYPAMPESASPYSPSSRRWLNIIYIDVSAMPGYVDCSKTQGLVAAPAFTLAVAEQRSRDWVDYSGVLQLKLPVMYSLYQWFVQHCGKEAHLAAEFAEFKQLGGDSLQQLALYDALHAFLIKQDSHHWGWPNWPEQYRDPQSEAVQQFALEHQQQLDFYCYLQFIAQQQLKAVQQQAKTAGMLLGLYRDLAVGVSDASTEIWGNGDLYCRDASVGAPPDPLGPAGQNWGLPPMQPYQLFSQAYQPMVDLFRSNMQHAGALRIDHVMALLRLWWVPKTAANAGGGAYVYYPIMDLLGILALESQRQQAVIIGEDLGTVPDGIRELLADYGIYSYRVFFFETAADGGYISPAHYPVQAMATLSTHDLPTLIGFWHCEDLKLGQQLGLYKDESQLQGLYQQRHANKQQILDSLHGHGMLPMDYPRTVDSLGMDRTLNYAMQRHLAAGSSQLLCLQLEDWLEMTQPVNVPGTSDEYPNWRRKLSRELEQWTAEPHIQQLLAELTKARAS